MPLTSSISLSSLSSASGSRTLLESLILIPTSGKSLSKLSIVPPYTNGEARIVPPFAARFKSVNVMAAIPDPTATAFLAPSKALTLSEK